MNHIYPDRVHKYSGCIIQSSPATPIRERMYCQCGEGELVSTGNRQLGRGVRPPMIEHGCTDCGDLIFIKNDSFPRIVYK